MLRIFVPNSYSVTHPKEEEGGQAGTALQRIWAGTGALATSAIESEPNTDKTYALRLKKPRFLRILRV